MIFNKIIIYILNLIEKSFLKVSEIFYKDLIMWEIVNKEVFVWII